MPYILKDQQSNIAVGLGTYTYTVAAAGPFFVSASSSENPPLGLSLVINQNGSPKVSTAPVAAGQTHLDTQVKLNCAASDVITIVISSSLAIDNQLNTVKTIMVVRQGA